MIRREVIVIGYVMGPSNMLLPTYLSSLSIVSPLLSAL